MFVEVRYFQFLNFDIHDDVKSRYLRQVTEREQEERAQYELGEKVCGAGTVTYLLTLFFGLCISLMKPGWKKVIINVERQRGRVVRVPDLKSGDPSSGPAVTTSWICSR